MPYEMNPQHHGKADHHQQFDQGLRDARPFEYDVATPFVLVRVIRDRDHHQRGHHESRHDAREEQLSDRHVRHHSVDHERQRRRNDWAERGGSRGDANRKADGVALVVHRLDLDRAQARGVGDGSTRHAGEDHRADDVDMAQPAFEPADKRQCEIVNAIGDARVVHQVARHDEKRHGEQRKAVDAADHPVDDDERRQVAGEQDVHQRGAGHRDRDGNARRHHREKARQKCRRHTVVSPMPSSGRSSTL
jgi:hypothetical protein